MMWCTSWRLPGRASDFLHPLVFREAGRNHDVLIIDGSGGGHGELIGHFEDCIRLVDAPAIHELRGFRGFGGVAFAGAAIGPSHQCIDLFTGERTVVAELAEVRIGRPRRHLAGDDGFTDGLGPRPRRPCR